MSLVQEKKSYIRQMSVFTIYNNVLTDYFLPFLIDVLTFSTYGADAKHMWC